MVPARLFQPVITQDVRIAATLPRTGYGKEMMKAHTRLNEFVERGIVPEDLKEGRGS